MGQRRKIEPEVTQEVEGDRRGRNGRHERGGREGRGNGKEKGRGGESRPHGHF